MIGQYLPQTNENATVAKSKFFSPLIKTFPKEKAAAWHDWHLNRGVPPPE